MRMVENATNATRVRKKKISSKRKQKRAFSMVTQGRRQLKKTRVGVRDDRGPRKIVRRQAEARRRYVAKQNAANRLDATFVPPKIHAIGGARIRRLQKRNRKSYLKRLDKKKSETLPSRKYHTSSSSSEPLLSSDNRLRQHRLRENQARLRRNHRCMEAMKHSIRPVMIALPPPLWTMKSKVIRVG